MAGIENYFDWNGTSDPFLRISILISFDGSSWKETYSEMNGWAYAAAWDEANKRFLVQCITDSAPDAYTHSVFASADGLNWSRIETRPGVEAGPGPNPSSLLMATGTPLVKDDDGNIVPRGGYFGENKGVMIIKPETLNPYWFQSPNTDPTDAIEIIKRKIDPATGAETITRSNKSMPFPVASVAYAGGVWQACGTTEDDMGTLKIASSRDDGQTWRTDLTLPSHYSYCVMAGPEMADK